MAKKTRPTSLFDRWSYLWFAAGVVLLILSTGRFSVAFAAWLAPAFLIRFVRTQRVGKGYWMILLGLYVSLAIGWFAILGYMLSADHQTGWQAECRHLFRAGRGSSGPRGQAARAAGHLSGH
jgi:hypothetical protein